jgi:hypothetical protein
MVSGRVSFGLSRPFSVLNAPFFLIFKVFIEADLVSYVLNICIDRYQIDIFLRIS